jgi:hypothetical protein
MSGTALPCPQRLLSFGRLVGQTASRFK